MQPLSTSIHEFKSAAEEIENEAKVRSQKEMELGLLHLTCLMCIYVVLIAMLNYIVNAEIERARNFYCCGIVSNASVKRSFDAGRKRVLGR